MIQKLAKEILQKCSGNKARENRKHDGGGGSLLEMWQGNKN